MALTRNKYFTDLVLNFLLGTAPTTPSSIKAILTTALPVRTDTNSTLTRPGYAGYVDETISNGWWNSFNESLTGGTSMSTNTDINFVSPSSTPGSPITVNGFAILDNSNNVLYQGTLVAPLVINTSGQTIKIPSGSLIITES